MFADFVVKTFLVPRGKGETALILAAYYEPMGRSRDYLNVLFLRRLMAWRALRTIHGIKSLTETEQGSAFASPT
jgi:hypothetical protein